jgi:hypothetical protein
MTSLLALTLLTAAMDLPPPPPEESPYLAPRHVELAFGFVGGVRDLTRVGYVFEGGEAESIPFAAALAAPFSAPPYDQVPVYGVAFEYRYVARHLRITTGLQKPFAAFRLSDAIGTYDVGGIEREVGTRSLSMWDFRFGLGAEYSFRYVTPFVDLVGDAQLLNASLTIDGRTADYRAWAFGFSARAGLRVHLGDYLFLAPSGEYGLGGAVRYGASLQAGFIIPAG